MGANNPAGRGAPRLGIDLGGTKIEIVALAGGGGGKREAGGEPELLRRRIPAPQGDYAATLAAIVALVDAAEAELGARGTLGIGIPGSISPATGLVRGANSTWINGKPLQADLAALLARPVRVANDANCFALSEATDGAAAGATAVFGVILGTGVGGGLVIGGRIVTGANGIAGEWGHVPLPGRGDGPPRACWCGRIDCIETFLAGPALEREYRAATGAPAAAAEIAVRAESGGDAGASAAMARYAERLARALAMIINIADPEIVVLGGGLSNIAALFRDVPRLWRRHVFADSVATLLVPPRHGDSSGVRGAARLWGAGEGRQ